MTFNLFKSLLDIWLKNGFVEVILKLAETYIPKTFIFLKYLFVYAKALKTVRYIAGFLERVYSRPEESNQRYNEQVTVKNYTICTKVMPLKQEEHN